MNISITHRKQGLRQRSQPFPVRDNRRIHICGHKTWSPSPGPGLPGSEEHSHRMHSLTSSESMNPIIAGDMFSKASRNISNAVPVPAYSMNPAEECHVERRMHHKHAEQSCTGNLIGVVG
jgi:hypothetical protein